MKALERFRDAREVRALTERLRSEARHPWVLMEVCGGQTHAIVRNGLDQLLPPEVELIHGPGCPVCVTPVEWIDKAIAIARTPGTILCSFGDMLRVPGSRTDLLSTRAAGGDIRIVYSPTDALAVARANPAREVVFFAVGFETTAPVTALAVQQAEASGLNNFSLLTSHVLVPPALETLLNAPTNRVQGFLAAGHVCAVMGYEEYEPLAQRHRVPIVVTGFEPVDILEGILLCVRQLERGEARVENQYLRAVERRGNPLASSAIRAVFRKTSRRWRGLGDIPASGLCLAPAYSAFDAEQRFGPVLLGDELDSPCVSGAILQGLTKPPECPAFGKECTPEHPLGATMVSSEGACAAYYRYRGDARTEGTRHG